MREPGNEDQIFFYETRVAEMMQKIRENQQFIDAIYRRMGMEPLPAVYSIDLDPEKKEDSEGMEKEGMFEIA